MEPTTAEKISYTDVYPNGVINTENMDRNSFAPVSTPIFTTLKSLNKLLWTTLVPVLFLIS